MVELSLERLAETAGDTVRDQACLAVDARHGFTMEFAPCPEAHAQEYDDEERRLRALMEEHRYVERTKFVKSGQNRTYYNGSCTCRWRHRRPNGDPWFRVTDVQAEADWKAHRAALRPNEEGGEGG